MTIKMIAVDMDGTFLNDRKEYNVPRFNQLFKQLTAKNIKFVVASGNQYFQLRSFFPDTYQSITFVAENGANIVVGEQAFYTAELSQDTIKQTLSLLEKTRPETLILCGKNSAYVSENIADERFVSAQFYYPKIKKVKELNDVAKKQETIFKFALSFDETEADKILANLQTALAGKLIPVSSGHGDIDLIIPGIHKYHGLSLLGKEWGIADEEIAVFGDSGNDLEMIRSIPHSFAMENAQDKIKQAATTIISSNNTEGILDVIESIVEEDGLYIH